MELIKEIYDLFEKITSNAQMTRIMQFIEMPTDKRPVNYSNFYDAATKIVDWAEGSENGEEYRLKRLNKLKHTIQDVIGARNLPSNEPSKESGEHKYAKLLCSLNCDEQRESFFQAIKSQLGGAFLIQARQDEIQNWLVKSLTDYAQQYINDINEQKQYYKFCVFTPLKVKGKMQYDFDFFLTEFKRVCKIPDFQCLINGLTELGNTQSLIITIYGIRLLNKETRKNFYALWLILWNSFSSLNKDSILILFLVEDDNCQSKLSPFKFIEITSSGIPSPNILLPPLEGISQNHVTNWLKTEEVSLQLKSIYANEFHVKSILKKDDWTQEDPLCLLDEICQLAFNMKDGIASVEFI